MKLFNGILVLVLATGFSTGATLTETSFTACSLLGGPHDSVRGARIQSDSAKKAYPAFVDAWLTSHPVIAVSAGVRGTQILLAPADYIRVARATLAPLIRPLEVQNP